MRACSIEERSADTTATAGDMALAGTFARVLVQFFNGLIIILSLLGHK
ncbi:hypothetical protein [Mesorhizobium sp. B4-1-1]|nr:hypothetical protein [Mesorhizobium sp. B4-1-1]